MRRQSAVGRAAPAGSSRVERLDPFGLPVRFSAVDKTADERIRQVELTRERVIVRRAVRGMKMAVNLPVAAYLGVALRLEPRQGDCPGAVSIVLEHHDRALSLQLHRAEDATDIQAEWRSWAQVLGMPLLIAGPDGRMREAFERIGGVDIAPPLARRRRRSALRRRRPSILLRRKVGRPLAQAAVHRGEREIIARH
ncbi:MAG: hypothetical protein IT536_19060 [Hyphomicrobiales bacterium]|nr:hypothetical protein [Hyphomicrobiales bacterium]